MSNSEIENTEIDINTENESNYSKKLGGWLLFFKIINFIWLTFLPINLIAAIVISNMYVEELFFTVENGFIFLEVTPDFIFALLIILQLNCRQTHTPQKVKLLMTLEVLIKIIIWSIMLYAYKNNLISNQPYPVIVSLIYYSLWLFYFKKSKRVFGYYGANAK